MQNILDDNEIINKEDGYQLREPKFIKRIRLFAILSLVNTIFLFLLSIGFGIYAIILLDYQYFSEGEIAICCCSAFFSLVGSFLLFQTYKNNNKFVNNSSDTSFLIKGMNYFFGFWITLIFNFVFMGLAIMIWA